MALTCRDCNSSSGHDLDHHLKAREDLYRFALGKRTSFRRSITLGQEQLAATIFSDEGLGRPLVHVDVPPQANSEAAVRRGTEHFQSLKTISINFPPYKQHEANVSLLRSAFVVAFAFLGYRYVWGQSMAMVRQQIRQPGVQLLDGYSFLDVEAPLDRKLFCLIDGPGGSWCLVVAMGLHGIILPGPEDDPHELYRALRANSTDDRFLAQASVLGWPRLMEMHLDFRGADRQNHGL